MCSVSVSFVCVCVCRLSLAPPASHLSLPFLCSPLLTFLIIPLPKISPLLRMGSPPLEPTLHCVTHRLNIFITFPLGKNSNWWYFHLSSLSLLRLGKRWRFQIAHYLFSTQAQVGFQHRPYRDPDFPQSHNVLWAVLQSRHCIIMSFWRVVMWIVRKQELKDRVIGHCLTASSQFALVRALCSGAPV